MNQLSKAMQDAVDEGTVPGAITLVGRGEDVHVQVVGAMAVGGPEMRADAIVRIQSMTKPITAVAALLEVQEGRIGLDDPIERWLPELTDRNVLKDPTGPLDQTEPAHRPITVRDLLVNGSGYGMAMDESPWARAMQAQRTEAGPDPVADGANEWLARLATLPLAHQPGEGFRYHHSFGLLGILLQRAAGVPLQEHLQQRVLGPLGMVDTGQSVPESEAARLPAAYRQAEGGLVETEPLHGGFFLGRPAYDTAHGELVSTATDYHRFARMLAEGGRVRGETFLDDSLLAQMTRDQVAARAKTPDSFFPGFWDQTGWGYGVAITSRGEHAGRYGWSGGLGTDFFVDLDGTVAILLTQVELSSFALLERFQELARH